MNPDLTRRGAVLAVLGGGTAFLVRKAHGQIVWQVDAARCLNSRLGEVGVPVCNRCAISRVCPYDALVQLPLAAALQPVELRRGA